MSELKQMAFGVREDGRGRIMFLNAVHTHAKHVEHAATVLYDEDGSARVSCSCDGLWRISATTLSNDEIRGTFNSHLSYFDRPKTVTL